MAEKRSEGMECRIVGRLGREPEGATTLGGVPVCRLVVVNEAAGPASNPVRVGIYVRGAEARRCERGLREGDLIAASGELRSRRPGSDSSYPEVVLPGVLGEVKLYERAAVAA